MKIAFFDCPSGISGDMTLGALADCGVSLAAMQAGIDSLGYPGVKLVAEEVHRKGFRGLKVHVQHEPEKAHRHLHHIVEKIDASTVLTTAQKELAKRIFTRLGEAEAKVHGTTIRKVHFHEVGAVDSIAEPPLQPRLVSAADQAPARVTCRSDSSTADPPPHRAPPGRWRPGTTRGSNS